MTSAPGVADRPIVLCPLEFERQALQQTGFDDTCDLICTGPGCDRVADWALDHQTVRVPIVLAGLAGSMTPHCTAGSAHVIGGVIDEQGQERWTPTLRPPDDDDVTVTSTHAPITGRLARQIASAETGGMLIDLESAAFATAARKFRWARWGIIRGVSDDLTTLLPENIEEWVDDGGHTRWGMVMRSLLMRPTLIPKVLELREHSTAAMKSVAELLPGLLGLPTA